MTTATKATGEQPRGLARCDATALVELAEILADVIDAGNPKDTRDRRWHFDTADQATVVRASIDTGGDDLQLSELQREALADAARLDFIAEVRRRIIAKSAAAAAKAGDGNGGK